MNYFVYVNFDRQKAEPMFVEFSNYSDAFNFYARFRSDVFVCDCRLIIGNDLSLNKDNFKGLFKECF